jgi:hypothetical protein
MTHMAISTMTLSANQLFLQKIDIFIQSDILLKLVITSKSSRRRDDKNKREHSHNSPKIYHSNYNIAYKRDDSMERRRKERYS